MHTCIPSHGLKRCWHSCPRRVNAGNKNTPSMHHPWRRNVTTSMVGLKNGHIRKNLTQNGESPRYSWGMQKKKKNPQLYRLSMYCPAHLRDSSSVFQGEISDFDSGGDAQLTCCCELFQGSPQLLHHSFVPSGMTKLVKSLHTWTLSHLL